MMALGYIVISIPAQLYKLCVCVCACARAPGCAPAARITVGILLNFKTRKRKIFRLLRSVSVSLIYAPFYLCLLFNICFSCVKSLLQQPLGYSMTLSQLHRFTGWEAGAYLGHNIVRRNSSYPENGLKN
jgi:hypothetical protein